MTEQNYPTRIVTEEVRFSFVNLLKPKESQFGGDEKYSVTILIKKTDAKTMNAINGAIEAAKQKGKAEKWNGVIPPVVNIPLHDGDGVKPSDGMPFGPECKGHFVLTASTGLDYPPKVVGPDLQPVMDATEIYSGMYGRIALNFNPYVFSGKKGVGCYISTNVQKTRDGEPLGASAPDAGSDFGGAPAQAAPQYQQPAQQYQQPTYQQPPYGQTAQPAAPQPYDQTQGQGQRFDPLTGQFL